MEVKTELELFNWPQFASRVAIDLSNHILPDVLAKQIMRHDETVIALR